MHCARKGYSVADDVGAVRFNRPDMRRSDLARPLPFINLSPLMAQRSE
jgi:hypothetical protein